MHRQIGTGILLLTIAALNTASCTKPHATVVPKEPSGAASDASTVNEFNLRLKKYVELRDALAKELPPLKDKSDAVALNAHRQSLAAAVRKARASVQQGEIFTPAVRAYMAKVIRSEMRGAEGEAARDSIKEGNPKFETPLAPAPAIKVNAPYPETQPHSSMPAALLLRLPTLPEDIQYRFVGRDLILSDGKTGLVVDIFPAAAPSSLTRAKS